MRTAVELTAIRIVRLIERATEPLLKEAHIKAYAQRMIVKDRERVKESLLPTMAFGSAQRVDETPIILD